MTITIATAPRTKAKLTSLLYRAAGDLAVDAQNARTVIERDKALEGYDLCAAMFVRLAKR